MATKTDMAAKAQRPLTLAALCVLSCGALLFAVPGTGLARAGDNTESRAASFVDAGLGAGLDLFTPASADPALAARVAGKARARGFRFTPARAAPIAGARTVTVAVRMDDQTVGAISVRKAINAVPGRALGVGGIEASRFQLGAARGYKSFARTVDLSGVDLSANVRSMSLPDLAQFEPSRSTTKDKPSRLQPRIELEDREIAGRSPNTLDSIGAQTVGVGGSFSLSPNLNVTAGVRYSQERERIDPLTNALQDSQAVYVGTQIKF